MQLHMQPDNHDWFREIGRDGGYRSANSTPSSCAGIRPSTIEYLTATWLLERAEAAGVRVFNRPRALRDHSEKVAIAEFPQFAPETLISRDVEQLQQFIDELADVILKPLDGMGGSQIFRVRHADPNRNVIIETLTREGARTIMAQRFLPEIAAGDKRILLIAGNRYRTVWHAFPRPGKRAATWRPAAPASPRR
jgi:glutathione synthase